MLDMTHLGEERDQNTQEHSRRNLDTQRHLPLGVVGWGDPGVCAVPDPSRAQRSNSQHELLQGCNSSTNAGVTDLGLVQGNNHGQVTDTRKAGVSTSNRLALGAKETHPSPARNRPL